MRGEIIHGRIVNQVLLFPTRQGGNTLPPSGDTLCEFLQDAGFQLLEIVGKNSRWHGDIHKIDRISGPGLAQGMKS